MMRTLILLALLLPATAAAQERVRSHDFQAMPPQRIADALLPPGHVPIAAVAFDRMGGFRPPAPFVPTISTVRFFTPSAPIAADFCLQSEIVATIVPIPDAEDSWLETPPRLIEAKPGRQLYRYREPGAACDGTQPHFAVYGMPAAQALDGYRALVAASRQAQARPARPLPYGVSCEAMWCGSARDEMRDLNLPQIVAVEPLRRDLLDGRERYARLGRMPSRTPILFQLPMVGMRDTSIRAIFHRGRLEHVAVIASDVVF